MIIAVAVVGKKNNPLFLNLPEDRRIEYQFLIHSSLDVVEEKISSLGKAATDSREQYLGLLYPAESNRVYGYLTNTKVKFILVVDEAHSRDSEMRAAFKRIHTLFVSLVSDPFFKPDAPITSKRFAGAIQGMIATSLGTQAR